MSIRIARSLQRACQEALVVCGAAGLMAACGVVGSPIAPEDVGVNPTINRQKLQHAREAQQQETTPPSDVNQESGEPMSQGPELDLPPLRPVGAR